MAEIRTTYMIATLANFLFFLLVGLVWLFKLPVPYALEIAGAAALVLAVIYFLQLIGQPVR